MKKDEWARDSPLIQSEGGATAALNSEDFQVRKPHMETGGNYIGLGCLGWLSNELSLPGVKVEPARVEGLGRKLWATQRGAFSNCVPILPNAYRAQADGFWIENEVNFPSVWPEKAVLPIAVVDASFPSVGKFRLLAMDEVVLSFWLFVNHLMEAAEQTSKLLQDAGGESPELQKKADAQQEQLAKARKLARNVVFSIVLIKSEDDRLTRSLSCREQLETFREFCGLSGWQKVTIVGQRRDQLRERKLAHKPEDLAKSLADVQWGPGRAITGAVASKILGLWNRVGHVPALVNVITEAWLSPGRGAQIFNNPRNADRSEGFP